MNGFVKVRLQSLLNKTSISSAQECDFASKSKVLILSPHYDDDVLSCFGAMMKHSQMESEIHILYITDGSASRDSGVNSDELIKIRKQESKDSVLAYFPKAKLMHYGKKDGEFIASEQDIFSFSKLLEKEKYNYIYCPSIIDTHSDHKHTFNLLKQSIKMSKLHCVIRLYEFWYPLRNPNVYIDLKGFEKEKWNSISYHKSQLKFLNYVELAKIVNSYRGKQVGCMYAEVYQEISSKDFIYEQNEEKVKLSVIIPAYNNENYVSMLLKSLTRQKCNFNEWEIILVDDSEDKRMTQFEKWNIRNLRIIEKEHSGRADTRNVGIRNSKGEILVFMDSDMVADENFIQRHFDSHQKGDCDISLGKVNHILNENLETVRQIVDEGEIQKLNELVVSDNYLNLTRIVFKNREVADYIGWICCLFSNCSVKREVLDKVGLFDDIFVGWGLEDVELGYRFFKENFRFSYFEDIQNYHVDHATDSNKMLVEMGQNLKRLSKKHPNKAIKSYMSFVAGFKDIQELLNDVSNKNIEFASGCGIYFKPLNYAKSKS